MTRITDMRIARRSAVSARRARLLRRLCAAIVAVSPPAATVRRPRILARVCAVVVAVSLVCAVAAARAQTFPDSREVDRIALALVRAGQWSLAAEQWSSAVPSHLESLSSADERRVAGRSLVLAALAWERAGDVRAYRAWSDAIRLYLESGTTWEQERSRLKDTSDTIDAALRQMPSSSAGPNRIVIASAADLLSVDLERELTLSAYNGPGPGLKSGDSAQDSASIGTAATGTAAADAAGAIFLPRAIDTSAEPPAGGSYLDPMPIGQIGDLLALLPAIVLTALPESKP